MTVAAPLYSLDELAADAVGLMDQLGVAAAHVVGISMGGMIAQLIAIKHPDRVLSLVSIMSTTGNRRVGQPIPRVAPRMLRKVPRDRDGYIESHVANYRTIGSKGFDFDEQSKRERAGRVFDRGIHPAGSARQLAAIVSAPDRTELLAGVRPHHGHSRRCRSYGQRLRRPRHSEGNPQRQPGHHPRHGPRPTSRLWPQIIGAITQNAASAANGSRDPGPRVV